ncbi:MAG TPA: tRNA pseudouridine(13) synthase TruD, partial [Pseudomonadaceae bacterium]|nr:tRNA pseudouridine(13) synthase TruD [Pseudomonadaceae bacterium]
MSLPQAPHSERPASSWVADCQRLNHALGVPEVRGRIKVCAEDFEVEEILGFEPDGAGEHLFVYVEKSGLSTPEAQGLLARHFALAPRDVAFSGMKDKQALTRQWFSLHTGSRRATEQAASAEEWSTNSGSGALRILRAEPNSRKLRRGSHRLNRFRIRVRAVQADREQLLARLAAVVEHGVPNYFGPQRFGYGASTLLQALAAGARPAPEKRRNARSMQLSAARSFL